MFFGDIDTAERCAQYALQFSETIQETWTLFLKHGK